MTATVDPTLDQRADALLSAVGDGDLDRIRSFFAPQARIWHNFDLKEISLEENLPLLERLLASVKALRYTDVVRHRTSSGFIELHNLRAVMPDGSERVVPACQVFQLDLEGAITRLEEYVDLGQLQALLGA